MAVFEPGAFDVLRHLNDVSELWTDRNEFSVAVWASIYLRHRVNPSVVPIDSSTMPAYW